MIGLAYVFKNKMHVRLFVELHLFFVANLRLAFSASDCAKTLANKLLWTAE